MTASPTRPKKGNIVSVNGRLALVIKVGRSQMYSIFVLYGDGTTKLITEAAWWMQQGSLSLEDGPDQKPQSHNVKKANEYIAAHAITIPDI